MGNLKPLSNLTNTVCLTDVLFFLCKNTQLNAPRNITTSLKSLIEILNSKNLPICPMETHMLKEIILTLSGRENNLEIIEKDKVNVSDVCFLGKKLLVYVKKWAICVL